MSIKMSKRRLEYRRAQAAQWRGQAILAEKFMEIYAAISLHSRNYRQLDSLERRQRFNRTITELRTRFAIFEGEEEKLAVLEEGRQAHHLLDAGIQPPLLAPASHGAQGGTKFLRLGEAPTKRQFDLFGAWALASLQRLLDEGSSLPDAKRQVKRTFGVGDKTINNWRAMLERDMERDNFPFLPCSRGTHLQRLSFRVRCCLNYAASKKLSGLQMLDLMNADSALVCWLSARRRLEKLSLRGG